MLAQPGHLFPTNLRCGIAVQLRMEFRRDLIGELVQQAHNASAMLVDGQPEAEPKLSIILKQRVAPSRTAPFAGGSVFCPWAR